MPSNLTDYVAMCLQLSLPRTSKAVQPANLNKDVTKGMNPKKRHEVELMTQLVSQVSLSSNCPLVVDIGAGLGYLSAAIARDPLLHVLALECREMLTHGTEARALQQGIRDNLYALTFNLQDNNENFLTLQGILFEKLQYCKGQRHLRCQPALSCISSKSKRLLPDSEIQYAGCSNTEPKWVTRCNGEKAISTSHTPSDTNIAPEHCTSEKRTTNNSCSSETRITGGSRIHMSSDSSIVPTCNATEGDSVSNGAGLLENQTTATQIESDPGICLIGLHCCGSLTPIMMKLFASTSYIQSLVCVSCCYHGLHQQSDKTWTHFPMSQVVGKALFSKVPDFKLSTFAMRLAAQETGTRWASQTREDHTFHENSVAFRGLLQLICRKEGVSIGKERRRIAKRKDMRSLDTYIAAVRERTQLGEQCPDIAAHLHNLYTEQLKNIQLIEPFTALQVALQPVLESLIIVDRVLYLREAGFVAHIVPIFDDMISPRNLAIVAHKSVIG